MCVWLTKKKYIYICSYKDMCVCAIKFGYFSIPVSILYIHVYIYIYIYICINDLNYFFVYMTVIDLYDCTEDVNVNHPIIKIIISNSQT